MNQRSSQSVLPSRYPQLRDCVILLAIISAICYFIFSEGARSFVDYLVKIFARLLHA